MQAPEPIIPPEFLEWSEIPPEFLEWSKRQAIHTEGDSIGQWQWQMQAAEVAAHLERVRAARQRS
jgi:hypothetical protein